MTRIAIGPHQATAVDRRNCSLQLFDDRLQDGDIGGEKDELVVTVLQIDLHTFVNAVPVEVPTAEG